MSEAHETAPHIVDMPAALYHRHPALSSTGARTLARECPAVYQHKRENPERKQAFDIGSATHLLTLEPHLFDAGVVLCGPDFKTKGAQEQRDAAYAADRIPLRDGDLDLIRDMRAALQADPIASTAFVGGEAERSLFWTDPEFGIRCRTRPDYLPPHNRYLVDLKASATSNPADFAKDAARFGYHAQASFYLDGAEATRGFRPERFAFVVVSKEPPHLVTTHWVDAEALAWGAIENRFARGVFAWCERAGVWPSYAPDITAPAQAFTLTLPGWKRRELEQRHEAGGFEPPAQPTEQEIAA